MQTYQVISVQELDEQGFSIKYKNLQNYFAEKKLQEPNFWLFGGKISELDPKLYVCISSWGNSAAFNQYLIDKINKDAKLRNFAMTEFFAKPETGKSLQLFSGFAKISQSQALRKNMLQNVLPKIVGGAQGFIRIGHGFNIYTGPDDLHQFVVLIMWENVESQKALQESEDFRPLLLDFNEHLKYIYMYNIEIK